MRCSYLCPWHLALPTETSGYWLGIGTGTNGGCEALANVFQLPAAAAASSAAY
jgi:hypothetical protein